MGISFLGEESARNRAKRESFLSTIVQGTDGEESAVLPSFREECGGVLVKGRG